MLDWNNFFGQARQAQDSQLNRALALADLSLRQDTQKHQQRMDEIRNLHEQNYQTWLQERAKAMDTRATEQAKKDEEDRRRSQAAQALGVVKDLLGNEKWGGSLDTALQVAGLISPDIEQKLRGAAVRGGQVQDQAQIQDFVKMYGAGSGAPAPAAGEAVPPAPQPSPIMGMAGTSMPPQAALSPVPAQRPVYGPPSPSMPSSAGAVAGPAPSAVRPTQFGMMGAVPSADPTQLLPPQPQMRTPEQILSQQSQPYLEAQRRKDEELHNQTVRARAAELRAKLAEEESPSKIAEREARTDKVKQDAKIAEEAFKGRLGPWARSAALLQAQQKLSREALTMREGLASAQKTLLAARTVTERAKLSDKQKSETDKAKRFALSAYNTFDHQAQAKKKEANQIKFRLISVQKDYESKMAEFTRSAGIVEADPSNKAEEQRMWGFARTAGALKKSVDDLEDLYNQATEEHQVLEQDAGQTHDMLTKAGVLSQSDGKGSGFKKRNPSAAGKTSSDHLKSFSEAIGAGP